VEVFGEARSKVVVAEEFVQEDGRRHCCQLTWKFKVKDSNKRKKPVNIKSGESHPIQSHLLEALLRDCL
jgi:hypothetical protein